DSLGLSTFNLGIDGQTFDMQYFRHLLALKNNPKPTLIIHSLDIGSLQRSNLYNPDQFLPYMLWDEMFYDRLSKYEGYSYFDYKIPLVRYYGRYDAIKTAIKLKLNLPEEPGRIRGYQPHDMEWNDDFENARMSMEGYRSIADSLTEILFDKYLHECKEQGICIILVYSPYYIEGQQFIENQAEVIDMYRMFARKYDLLFLDFTKDEICLDKSYFYNASHMNRSGAELFTRKLCSQILLHQRTSACKLQ
ncbi:MAG: hypothetical protein ABIY71_00565, partial [Flavobacteriales bacterium]